MELKEIIKKFIKYTKDNLFIVTFTVYCCGMILWLLLK